MVIACWEVGPALFWPLVGLNIFLLTRLWIDYAEAKKQLNKIDNLLAEMEEFNAEGTGGNLNHPTGVVPPFGYGEDGDHPGLRRL